jgi:hypothetical protein
MDELLAVAGRRLAPQRLAPGLIDIAVGRVVEPL